MVKRQTATARDELIAAGSELFRRHGFVATSVDEICSQVGVTKGAFFHHFESKEALGKACLKYWAERARQLAEDAPFRTIENPLERAIACMDFYTNFLSHRDTLKSCLVGTTVQEVSETHPGLREEANCCFDSIGARFKALLDAACADHPNPPDTTSLTSLWMATIQGSLILYKASRDEGVILRNLTHAKAYIAAQLDPGSSGAAVDA